LPEVAAFSLPNFRKDEMDIWDMRNGEEYRRSISIALAEADVELAKAQADPDLKSEDTREKVFAEMQLARCKANAEALLPLVAQIGDIEGISDDGD